jgi:hypothetical protein
MRNLCMCTSVQPHSELTSPVMLTIWLKCCAVLHDHRAHVLLTELAGFPLRTERSYAQGTAALN